MKSKDNLEDRLRIIYDEEEYEILFSGGAYAIKETEEKETTIFTSDGTLLMSKEIERLLPILDKETQETLGYALITPDWEYGYREKHFRHLMKTVEMEKESGDYTLALNRRMAIVVLTKDFTIETAEMEICPYKSETAELRLRYKGKPYISTPRLTLKTWYNESFI